MFKSHSSGASNESFSVISGNFWKDWVGSVGPHIFKTEAYHGGLHLFSSHVLSCQEGSLQGPGSQ